MRPIKFRAWDVKFQKMYFSHGDSDESGRVLLFHGSWEVDTMLPSGDYAETIPCNGKQAILMQFTGLHDKNGKEIYEGDIVLSFSNINKISDPHLTNRDPEYDKKFIKYKNGAFILSSKQYDFCGVLGYNSATKPEILEVIGNIYESPELLE